MQKEFLTSYKYRNIYSVIDGIGKQFYICEPIAITHTPIATRVADSLDELKKQIDADVIFAKLYKTRVL